MRRGEEPDTIGGLDDCGSAARSASDFHTTSRLK
jgi:hypothetical protein